MESSKSVARASTVMALGTLTSRALGFVRAIVLATAIGVTASVGADAFSLGNMLPNNVYMVLVGGMLSAVFVPQIVSSFTRHDGGTSYVNKLVTLCTVVLIGITLIATLLTPLLVRLYASSWNEAQLNLAIGFGYWCMPQIFLFGLFNILGEVLNAKKIFGPSSWAPALNNVVSILILVVYIYLFGDDPQGTRGVQDWSVGQIALIGGGATLGVIVQSTILIGMWRKAGIGFRLDFAWKGVGFGTLGKIAGWSLAAVIVMQLGGIVSTNVASTASGKGASIAALQYAWLIFMLPFSILAFSIGTAYFTRLAEAVKAANEESIRADISSALRSIGLVMVLSAGVVFITAPYISAVVMSGASAGDIAALSRVIQMYIIALVPYGAWFVIQRAFFAYDDTRTPFFFTLLQIILFSTGSVIVALTVSPDWIAASLALAFAISTCVQVVVGLFFMARRTGGFEGRRVLGSHLKYFVAALPMIAVGLLLTLNDSFTLAVASFGFAVGYFALVAAVMVVAYVLALYLLRSSEVTLVTSALRSRLSR